MTIYLVESGEYEDRCVDFVAASVDAAVKHLKEGLYSPPYIVTWGEVTEQVWPYGTEWEIIGTFSPVPGLSIARTKPFTIRAMEVVDA